MSGEDRIVVPGVSLSDLPRDRDQLWDYADEFVGTHGTSMDTLGRERVWSLIVAAVNPAWVVGLSQRARMQQSTLDDPAPLPQRPRPGDQVRIRSLGELVGPFTVADMTGRTEEHLVLDGPSGLFEHYWDPYNTYPG